jgi:hypothetical protein
VASNFAQLADDTSKVLKDASTIAIGNEIIAGARPLPPRSLPQLT